MSKPINENIRDVRIENEEGDLIPILDHAGEEFSKLVNAVVATGKAGAITLKIDIKPSTAGALAVKGTVTAKTPKGLPPESLLWPTPEGNLLSEDPRQLKIELTHVTEPVRALKVSGVRDQGSVKVSGGEAAA
jgi:hypothetical protein